MKTENPYAPGNLTIAYIEVLKIKTNDRIEVRDINVTGLVIRVTPKNRKTFKLCARSNSGEKMQITIGKYPVTTLKEARRVAKEHLIEVQRGHDPREKARLAKALAESDSLTLTDLLDGIEPVFAKTR